MSNATPKPSPKKIKSAPKLQKIIAAVFAVAVLFGLVVLMVGLRSDAPRGDYRMQTESQTYTLDAALTTAEQEKGLGSRANMPANRGMIFIFDRNGERCFWMKDMRFPLDIIWAGADKRVTHIESNLSPNTYPKSYCAAAQYVIELNARQAAIGGITKGQKLNF